jgi:hypothetical protein
VANGVVCLAENRQRRRFTGPAMTEVEVSDLLGRDGTFEWFLSDRFGLFRRIIWESADGDRITLVFECPEDKYRLTDKSLTLVPLNSVERMIRRIRRKLGY